MVLKQGDMIPKVPRCFGSATHLYEGLPRAVVLVAGFSICFAEQEDNRYSKMKNEGFTRRREQVAIILYAGVLYALRFGM